MGNKLLKKKHLVVVHCGNLLVILFVVCGGRRKL